MTKEKTKKLSGEDIIIMILVTIASFLPLVAFYLAGAR